MKTFISGFLIMLFCGSLYSQQKKIGGASASGRWVKVARIQNQNPIGGGDCANFSGTVNVQTDFGQAGSSQYHAIFAFGSRGGIKPLLQEFGASAGRPSNDLSRIEWRIYTDAQGWHYLWFFQSNYSRYATFNYDNSCSVEYWTYENPPSNFTQVWSSLNGERQENISGPLEIIQEQNPVLDNGIIISENNNSQTIKLHLANNSSGEYGYFHLGGTTNLRGNGQPSSFDGSVGIGTSNPGSWKLAVKGKIRAEEIKVETGWADYVFKKDYNLPSLKEVEKHIKEKGHLINIPSAKEVAENGILLGEMNKLLLEKIEELTLYTLSQEEKIRKQHELLKQFEKKLDSLIQKIN